MKKKKVVNNGRRRARMPKARNAKNVKTIKKKYIIFALIVILAIIATIVFNLKNSSSTNLTSEILRSLSYEEVEDGDEAIDGVDNVEFDAFFLKDLDSDGVAESIRGTCNEVGSSGTLYMELNVVEEGYVTDGKITINGENFYLNTSIVADDQVAANYISTNTTSISFNDIENGTQKLLTGSVRSGNYSSTSTMTSAIGTNTNNYSRDDNYVVFSGTYVDSEGNETEFSKTVYFTVDWYGEVNIGFYNTSYTSQYTDLDSLVSDDGLTLSFTVTTTETLNELIMKGSYIYGTIPEFNGYSATSVKISGTNVTYTYDEETGEFTAQREAVVSSSTGKTTTNGYSSKSGSTTYNQFTFTVVYPAEAYEELGEDVTSFSYSLTVYAYNQGYNNPNEEDGFENPYTSSTKSATITITFKEKTSSSSSSTTSKVYSPSLSIYVGTYNSSPYYDYIVSKQKPLNIYNGASEEETDDTYIVQWKLYTGTNGDTDGIILYETKTDQFKTSSSTYYSMEDVVTNTGIYFSGATSVLGSDGWIEVYDDDTDILLETFTSETWGSYSKSSPYEFENPVDHIRIETSETNADEYFYVYSVKELDDAAITENYTKDEFDTLSNIYSYVTGKMIASSEDEEDTDDDETSATSDTTYFYSSTASNDALYIEKTSYATLSVSETTLSTQVTTENEIIKITTTTSYANAMGWEDGMFLVKLPDDILLAEVNSVSISNSDVTISAYDLYEEDDCWFIKILTSNESEATYTITIDCDLTPDPRISQTTESVALYAINGAGSNYYYSSTDKYDLDGDGVTSEKVNYRTVSVTLQPGNGLTTVQTASGYDEEDGVTIAPRVAQLDKEQRTATVTVSLTNNYSYEVTDISILGVIPFEGNTSPYTGKDLGSDYTTYMTSDGITIPEELEGYVTIYYSTNANATEDLDDEANGWTLAEDVEDWSEIKTYLIVIDSSYSLSVGENIEFSYTINIPEGVDYNEVSYSAYAVYFALATDEGLYYTSTSSQKLGFMVAKQYDLSIVKYQEDTDKVIQGVTFTLTEDGEDSSSIATTDENGTITFSSLYAERYYTLKEQSTTDDYVLNEEEIRFYTYTVVNDDDSESLYLVYVDDDGNYLELTDVYSWIRSTDVYNASSDSDSDDDYTITISLDNEVKPKLQIIKLTEDGEVMKNVKFTLSGEGIGTKYLTTDGDGLIDVSGLYLGYEYTLTETKATGYYVAQQSITFTIENVDGEFVVTYSDENGITSNYEIITDDEIPTLTLTLTNEKIPTYSIEITKYAVDSDEVLANAQFKIYGEGISENGKVYTTDENGVLTIDGLYEYVEGKYITGEYTITEIYAPEGYALDSTTLKFRAYRDENGELQIEILEGESVIRIVTSDEGEESQDVIITDGGEDNSTISIGVENNEIFKLYKYYTDDDGNEIGLEGVQFIITDLDGNYVTGSDGEIIGELTTVTIDGVEQEAYVVTTDEDGLITANLTEGLYQVVEVATGEAYQLDSTVNYFGIGTSQGAAYAMFAATIQGEGFDYINSVEALTNVSVVGVGSISLYGESGSDLNQDGVDDETSLGSDDGLIVEYNANNELEWSATFGGTGEDEFLDVVQTSDGGFAIVGSTDSQAVYYDGTYIEELSSSLDSETLGNKDAVLIKVNSSGNYEWGVRFGGTLDDEATAVIETSDGNIAITGTYYSSTFNFLNTGSETVQASLTKGSSTVTIMNGFVASYTTSGEYSWSQNISGSYDSEVVDITETSEGIAIAVNHISTVYLNTSKSTSQAGASTSYVNGTVVGYDLDGNYSWRYRFYPSSSSYNVEITSLSTGLDEEIYVGVNHAYTLYGGQNGSTGDVITSSTTYYAATVVEITNTGEYTETIYTLDGAYDDYVSGVAATADGGVLIGGWTYTTSAIDADGDGETGGDYDIAAITGTYTCDGFMIRLDEEGEVEYLSQLYGDGYDIVSSVDETENGIYAVGGSFTSTSLSATNFNTSEEDEEETDVIIESLAGNTDAFIIAEGESSAEVPELQTISIENVLKEFTITTEVIAHEEDGEEVDGGTITGNTGTYDGTTYSEGEILYVETVSYGKDGTVDITITPDDGYTVASITVNGEEYTTYTVNSDGTVTISAFADVTEDIHVTVEFSNTIGYVTVNHYLWTEDEGTTTTKVADSKTLTGDVGDTYTTEPETELADYEIITNADYYGDDLPDGLDGDNYYIPGNSSGTYVSGETQIVDYYYKEKTYTLTVYYYLAGTDEAVPLKGSSSGETVSEVVTEGYYKNDEYTTEPADEDTVDYNIYELVETPENAEGTITENTVVIYYYQEIEVSIEITKVSSETSTDEDGNTVYTSLEGVEFTLFRLICEDSSHEHDTDDDLIDVDDYDETCWELIGTYTTDENGVLSLEDLEITGIYRLVETKTVEDYLVPEGQWKIEFDYGQFEEEDEDSEDSTDETDESTSSGVVDYNGQGIKITAIGNPPAFSLQTVTSDDDETDILYLYNAQSYDIPTSGGIGIEDIYKFAVVLILAGTFVILYRKKNLIFANHRGKRRKRTRRRGRRGGR